MSQHDYNIANDSGAAVRADINTALSAIVTQNSGPVEPATMFQRMVWIDTTNALRKRRNASNSAWIIDGTIAETLVISRSSNTVLTDDDYSRTFVATGTFTQTFSTVSTLTDGWHVFYKNAGTGVITFDPSGSETIDGVTTVALLPGEACRIACNGSQLTTMGRSALPPGAMVDFGGAAAPSGWLLCDGSAVSRTTFAALFTAIGTLWGSGDGSSTFNVPDFRRRVAVGSGGSGSATLGNAVGNTGGAETHTLTVNEMPSHSHTINSWDEFDPGVGNSAGVNEAGGFNLPQTNPTGGGAAHNNIQPSAVVLKIIKT